MFVRRRFVFILILVMLAAAVRPLGAPAEPLPPGEQDEVVAILLRHGLREPAGLERRGALWIAEARAQDGQRVRAVVDTASGELAGLRRLNRERPNAPGARAGH